MSAHTKTRRIDQRVQPPVKGIDLWQAMNYISLDDVSTDFIYDRYTSKTICYTQGSRPVLEATVKMVCETTRDPFHILLLLMKYVAEEVRWAGFHEREHSFRLPVDRNFTEEEILLSGFGWCNEQARLLCALSQVSNIPARIVFAGNREGTFGHVVTEALTPKGWMAIDQSLNYLFMHDGNPVNAWEVAHVSSQSQFFAPVYFSLCQQLKSTLGHDLLSRDFKMALSDNPLSGFETLGYCSYCI